jgi:hypothetical protein
MITTCAWVGKEADDAVVECASVIFSSPQQEPKPWLDFTKAKRQSKLWTPF